MKVKEVEISKEVIRSDVSPVAMFLFYFTFTIRSNEDRMDQHFTFTFTFQAGEDRENAVTNFSIIFSLSHFSI